jgi:hypothetical protein
MGRPKGIIRRIADELAVDQASVRRALAAANLSEQDALANFDHVVETVRAVVDTDRVIGHAANGRGEGGNQTSPYAQARAQAELHRARKLELLNAKLEGQLVDRAAVTETGARIIAEVRTALLSLGPRIAPKVADKSDTREIARIVETEVRDVLGNLADEERFFAALESESLN